MKVWRGGLDQMALWQVRTAQAMKTRMREEPQRGTNPGLASWLADAVHETFLWQTGATWQGEVSGKAANKERNDWNPQIFLLVAFGGYTMKETSQISANSWNIVNVLACILLMLLQMYLMTSIISRWLTDGWGLSGSESKEETSKFLDDRFLSNGSLISFCTWIRLFP